MHDEHQFVCVGSGAAVRSLVQNRWSGHESCRGFREAQQTTNVGSTREDSCGQRNPDDTATVVAHDCDDMVIAG